MAGRKHANDVNYDEDLDEIDFQNYKGMFFNDDPGQKYQDELTGAHFEYHDMCHRLKQLLKASLCPPQPSSPEDLADSVSTKEIADGEEGKVHKSIKENGQALLALQKLMPVVPKESRNGVQALPQQGYGTASACCNNKEGTRASGETKNFRQFSSQFQPADAHPKKVRVPAIQASNRSKSIDKPHFGPKSSSGTHAGGMMLRASNIPKSSKKDDSKHETLYALYTRLPNTAWGRQKNIEQLLEEKSKPRAKYRPSTNYRYSPGCDFAQSRTKTINLGLDKSSVKWEKSRNTASRTQDRKTFDSRTEKRDQGKKMYQTQSGSHPEQKKVAAGDQLKKIRVNLIGAATGCSRNVMQSKTSVKAAPAGHMSRFGGSKRAYVASLLQPSVSMKK